MKIVGIQKGVKFTIDKVEYRGMNLFGTIQRPNVDGVATEKIFVNETKECYATALSLKVGDDVECYYNRYGKIDNLVPVKA